MERKKSQLIYNFLPEDTFNHAENGVIGKVRWIFKERESEVGGLPLSYILRRIRPRIQKWPNDVPVQASGVEIVEPDSAAFYIFPRVFECRVCEACTSIQKSEIEGGSPPYCGNCDRRLTDTEQLQFVVVCPCGDLDSVWVPDCTACGHTNPKFIRPTSRFMDAFWRCSQCQNRLGDAYDFVTNCHHCGSGRQMKVHSSSTTFYPQIERFVNIDDQDLEVVTNNERYQKDVIVDFLTNEDGTTASGSGDDIDAEMLEKLGITEEEYKKAKKETAEERSKRRESVTEWVSAAFDEADRRSLSEELFEYQSLLNDEAVGARTLEGLTEDIHERPDLSEAVLKQSLADRDKLNLDEVRLIEDFPITTIVYGFSRLNPGPGEESNMNLFLGEGGQDRFFALTTNAEAAMFSLDYEAVVDWLIANGIIDERPTQDLNRWFLDQLPEYPYYDEVDPVETSEVARHTLSLLHTLSHTTINAMDALSGYSKSSLIEYLLPHALSFVVYKHSDTDFSLGAMHTLLENRFTEVRDFIETDADICMYDPVCEHEENASCEGCMYISSISCDNGNHNLSRSTLYGGEFDDCDIVGFLDV